MNKNVCALKLVEGAIAKNKEIARGLIKLMQPKFTGDFKAKAELSLIAAVLIRAIADYNLGVKAERNTNKDVCCQQKDIRSAREFIFSDDCEEIAFSFLWCCNQLAEDGANLAKMIRAKLLSGDEINTNRVKVCLENQGGER